MKKFFAIAAFLLTSAGCAFSAPNHANEVDSQIDDRFVFDAEDFDYTTAFLNIEDDGYDVIPSLAADDVIAYAKKYLGRPYSYGSKGPKAFDCSGFTSFVFRNFDINLSASSSTQSTQGQAVSKGDIRPGDLLFFKGRRNGKGVGHVAIAVDVAPNGEVSFIHAATSKGIRIDHLYSDPYYANRYVCARRVIND